MKGEAEAGAGAGVVRDARHEGRKRGGRVAAEPKI